MRPLSPAEDPWEVAFSPRAPRSCGTVAVVSKGQWCPSPGRTVAWAAARTVPVQEIRYSLVGKFITASGLVVLRLQPDASEDQAPTVCYDQGEDRSRQSRGRNSVVSVCCLSVQARHADLRISLALHPLPVSRWPQRRWGRRQRLHTAPEAWA